MQSLLLYTLVCTALWYLGSRALITREIWSRYPAHMARFMDCPACVGFWYGIMLGLTIGRCDGFAPLGLDATARFTPIVSGLCMIVLVPICAGFMQHGFDLAGTATAEIVEETEDDHASS